MGTHAHGKSSGRHLVVFGCGYIGTRVAEHALTRGMRVTALTRNAARGASLAALSVKTVVADLAGNQWHRQIDDAPDFVLNCVGSGKGGAEGYVQSYLGGMKSIVAWASSLAGAGTCVYTSSTAVYRQGGGALVREDDAPIHAEAATAPSDREVVLRATEAQLAGPGANGFRRWFVLRLAGIYGPSREHLVNQVRTGEVSGRPDSHLNLAHRDDIVAAIFTCFDAAPSVANDVFNVADDSRATKGEVVDWLARRLRTHMPRFTGTPLAGRSGLVPDRIIVNEKLKSRLGWRPNYPTFREGYAAML